MSTAFWGSKPLDTDNVDSFLRAIQSLSLTDYVSYHVTDEELAAFGLKDPELTVKLVYSKQNDDGSTKGSGTLLLCISRNPEEKLLEKIPLFLHCKGRGPVL